MDLIKVYEKEIKEGGQQTRSQEMVAQAKSGFVPIKEGAAIAGLSLYRFRQLYWEGKLKTAKKVDGRVYITREEAEEGKALRKVRKGRSDTLQRRRYGTRVIKSCETLIEIIQFDSTLNTTIKGDILKKLSEYKAEALKIEKQYK